MSTETTTKKIALIGMGQMGHYYAPILVRNMGIDAESIVLYDVRPEAMVFSLEELKKAPELEGIRKAASLSEALEGAHIAFNLTNSPSHLDVLKAMIAAKVQYIFAEKPIVPVEDLSACMALDFGDTEVIAGFVINFSGAVDALLKRMERERLYVAECVVRWGKNRRNESRPTAGVVDDEMPHGLELFRLVGGSFDDYEVRSIIGHQPFANPDVQLRAMALDPSFVLHPPATAQVFAQVDDENNQSSLMMDISYVRDDQVREVTFFLEDRLSADAHITAKLTFDTNIGDGKKGDVLEFGPIDGELERYVFTTNKLLDMMQSFFAFTSGAERDKRLTNFGEAIGNICFAERVSKSGRLGGKNS